jgi:hypothetical protein
MKNFMMIFFLKKTKCDGVPPIRGKKFLNEVFEVSKYDHFFSENELNS